MNTDHARSDLTLDDALQQLQGIELRPDPAFPDPVNTRLATVSARATAQCQKVSPDVADSVMRLLDVAVRAPTASKRVAWHRRAADALAAAYAPHSACKAGCNHCCYIPVKITATEARELGKAIGRTPSSPPLHEPVTVTGYSSPCSFLLEGQCSIYKHRPAVCRTHLNMDIDDLLCRHLPAGEPVPVPYLDTRALHAASVMIGTPAEPVADLRQWFPVHAGGAKP